MLDGIVEITPQLRIGIGCICVGSWNSKFRACTMGHINYGFREWVLYNQYLFANGQKNIDGIIYNIDRRSDVGFVGTNPVGIPVS